MKVLLTGAFGNVGTSAIEALLEQGHTVRCFDLKTRANEKKAARYKGRIEVVWGDLRRPEEIAAAVQDQDVAVHLAFIIPKLSATGVESESQPDWAREINVGGTRNLLDGILAQPNPPRLIFASSIHVYGQTQHLPPPRTTSEPVHPIEHYSRHKVECEEMIRASGIEWAILRFGAVPPLRITPDPGMFDVPLDNRIEIVHTRDVGLAIANAVSSEEIWGRILMIGGGPRCQLYFREMAQKILDGMGIGMLPDEAFDTTPFCTDWMDTEESQRLLQYQRHDMDDYVEDMKALLGPRRLLIRLFRPLVRWWVLRQSPYLPRPGRVREQWAGKVAVVTGGSSGIGAEIAQRLAREGLRVVLVARREEQLQKVAAEIAELGGEAMYITADLSQEAECQRVYDEVHATYGDVDILVNNAGLGWYGFGAEMPWSLARRMLQVNISAVAQLTLLFLHDMKERGKGHIINIGSIAGSIPSQGVALYGATKSFIDSFTTALYRELRGSGVRVSVVRPGAVLTSFFAKSSALAGALRMPAERLGVRPDVVAERVWRLVRRPARVVHIPRLLGLVPWIELSFGWLIDRIGPLLLRRQTGGVSGR